MSLITAENNSKTRKGNQAVVIRDLFGRKREAGQSSSGEDKGPQRSALVPRRVFSSESVHPYNEKAWVHQDALIQSGTGHVVFRQDGVEFPADWSMTAVNVVSSKYFHGKKGASEREHSLRQLLDRVVDTLTEWGLEDEYLEDEAEARRFNEELKWLLLNQHASFNSPVWFNVGIEAHPQCSACFINAVEDSMSSILDLAKTEGMLFKYGSGSGVNLSSLRSSHEGLSGGGIASGPVSFMRGLDAFAGAIKSGGKTRRAAKMVILNADHPDVKEFIECKAREERKARALVEMGFDGSLDGEVYASLMYQNANNSVRASDRFMDAVVRDKEWVTQEVSTGKPAQKYRARDLLRSIAEATHFCGDPGMQYDDNVNRWHTCPASGRINASNPCSEYMFLDNSACNLASLNLLRFLDDENQFDVDRFTAAVDLLILAQEIIIDRAAYPTPAIGDTSHQYRPLGLGYANLGAMLMALGTPYDSDEGRALAGAVSAVLTGEAYRMSALVAGKKGPFTGFDANRQPMLQVIRNHAAEVETIKSGLVSEELLGRARKVWQDAIAGGKRSGYRNAQVSVLAPTGTIGFMMDCDTTGVEPDISLVKYKKMVGGGFMKIVNQSVPRALTRLGYNDEDQAAILEYLGEHGALEGSGLLKEEHVSVFDCALVPAGGTRSIHYTGHLRMLAAIQPFISGAISKTVNVPEDCSVDEIYDIYLEAWKMGLKAVSVYRDNSKVVQPLSTGKDDKKKAAESGRDDRSIVRRRKLPDERQALTHKFSINGHEGYITVGMYEDGLPGEVFITMAKQGSTVSGLMDAFATAVSIAIQYGVPLETLVEKFSHLRFEPAGFTNNPEIPMAKSVMDYIFRWMASRFLIPRQAREEESDLEDITAETAIAEEERNMNVGRALSSLVHGQDDAPICHNCGDVMTRNGSCYKCSTCGETSGCS